MRPLSIEDLFRLQAILDGALPLNPSLPMLITLHNMDKDISLVDLVGAYGRLVSPPHVLIPLAPAGKHTLTEQGYRLQQVCIHLLALGIGSCFVGSLGRQKALQQNFNLPVDNLSGALLALGYPAQSFTGSAFNLLVRRAAGSHQRLSVEKLFFNDSFSNPSLPPDSLSSLIEAGRAAPSAVNAQPWRFLSKSGLLYLFVTRSNPKYGIAGKDYALFDGGICMANITLAMQAHCISGDWRLLESSDPAIPPHPQDLLPLAVLELTGNH